MRSSSRRSWARARSGEGLKAPGRGVLHDGAQKGRGRLARRQRVGGEAVVEFVQGEAALLGDEHGVRRGLGEVGQEPVHLGGAFEVALGVAQKAPARRVEGHARLDAGEHVEQVRLRGPGHAHVVGEHERHAEAPGQGAQAGVSPVLLPHRGGPGVPRPGAAARRSRAADRGPRPPLPVAPVEGRSERPLAPAGEREKPSRAGLQVAPPERPWRRGLRPGRPSSHRSEAGTSGDTRRRSRTRARADAPRSRPRPRRLGAAPRPARPGESAAPHRRPLRSLSASAG